MHFIESKVEFHLVSLGVIKYIPIAFLTASATNVDLLGLFHRLEHLAIVSLDYRLYM